MKRTRTLLAKANRLISNKSHIIIQMNLGRALQLLLSKHPRMPLMIYFTCHSKEILSFQTWQYIRKRRKSRTSGLLPVLALLYPVGSLSFVVVP